MDKKVMFTKEFLVDELYLPYNDDIIMTDNVIKTTRWSEFHEMVFKYDDKFYKTFYSCGLTELQDEIPWEYDREISCMEVEQKEMLVKQWVPVKE